MKQHRYPGPQEVVWIDDFLSARACSTILEELKYCFWSRSAVVSRRDGSLRSWISASRTSATTTERWFSAPLWRELRQVNGRIQRQLGETSANFEGWQATRYRTGQHFDYHHDSMHCREEPAGMRLATLLIYLNSPRSGGATHFRNLELEVPAVAGRLLYFRNVLPDGTADLNMIHSGLPVGRGQKVTLVNWVREHHELNSERRQVP
jgi:prolyl 4-hydroxylase